MSADPSGDEEGTLAARPPMYRKYDYVDENGNGRAIPVKAYSGLMGELFRNTREHELEQAVARLRSVLLENDKKERNIYLGTNPDRPPRGRTRDGR